MSRSGYTDDCDGWDLIRWRGAVASAIKGSRGQAMLKDLLAALDAMPEKRLIAKELAAEGEHCTLGVLGAARGLDMRGADPEDADFVAGMFGIAPAMVKEIVFENDDDFCWQSETPEQRWVRMRAWVASHIRQEKTA